VDDLIRLAQQRNRPLTRALLERVVAENDKQRFAFSEDGQRVRANQGHSLAVDLELMPAQPPERLYHGTAERNLDSIREKGLLAGSRQFVHLSIDVQTAIAVGRRHGRPMVLTILAAEMVSAGHVFYRSANGVWLTAHVPIAFIAEDQSDF
jgi:putative RNA 2'-phosphotransferase